MLESALLSGKSASNRRPVSLTLAVVLHGVAVLAVIGTSLWREEDLPAPEPPITLVTFAPAPPPAGTRTGAPGGSAAIGTTRALPPRDVPAAVSKLPELPPATQAAAGGEDAGRAALGDPVGVPGSTGDTPGALVPGAGADAGDAPLVIGGDVRAPSLLERSDPEYPEVARKARLEGVVVLQAVIGTDGRVEEIGVVKSASPILDEAAIRAVRRWRYRAATLNGKAVRVYLTVTADFRLR